MSIQMYVRVIVRRKNSLHASGCKLAKGYLLETKHVVKSQRTNNDGYDENAGEETSAGARLCVRQRYVEMFAIDRE